MTIFPAYTHKVELPTCSHRFSLNDNFGRSNLDVADHTATLLVRICLSSLVNAESFDPGQKRCGDVPQGLRHRSDVFRLPFSPPLSHRRYTSGMVKDRVCSHCGGSFAAKGLTAHERACGRRQSTAKRDREYEEAVRKVRQGRAQKRSMYRLFPAVIHYFAN